MHRHPLFMLWFILLAAIAVLHAASIEFYFYWTYPWFDTMMHFLGGLFVGLSTLWLFFESGYIKMARSIQNIVVMAAGAIVLIGISWEVFEVLAGIPMEDNYLLDTATDLVMDVLGTTIATVFFIKTYR